MKIKGQTTIILLVYLMVLSVIIGIIVILISMKVSEYTKSSSYNRANSDLDFMLNKITELKYDIGSDKDCNTLNLYRDTVFDEDLGEIICKNQGQNKNSQFSCTKKLVNKVSNLPVLLGKVYMLSVKPDFEINITDVNTQNYLISAIYSDDGEKRYKSISKQISTDVLSNIDFDVPNIEYVLFEPLDKGSVIGISGNLSDQFVNINCSLDDNYESDGFATVSKDAYYLPFTFDAAYSYGLTLSNPFDTVNITK